MIVVYDIVKDKRTKSVGSSVSVESRGNRLGRIEERT